MQTSSSSNAPHGELGTDDAEVEDRTARCGRALLDAEGFVFGPLEVGWAGNKRGWASRTPAATMAPRATTAIEVSKELGRELEDGGALRFGRGGPAVTRPAGARGTTSAAAFAGLAEPRTA